jgi:hypothetical protein
MGKMKTFIDLSSSVTEWFPFFGNTHHGKRMIEKIVAKPMG